MKKAKKTITPQKKTASADKPRNAARKSSAPKKASTAGAEPTTAMQTGKVLMAFGSMMPRSGPETIDPALMAARLYASKMQGSKVEIAASDTVAPIESLDPNDPTKQYLDGLGADLLKLLTDPGFVADDQIKNRDPGDMTRVLASMPFEFRWPAKSLFMDGIRYFGKVPWPENLSPEESAGRPDSQALFRHIGCPEGPGEGKRFGLAWIDGLNYQTIPPEKDIRKSYIDYDNLPRIARIVGLEFTQDLLGTVEDFDSVREYIGKAAKFYTLPEHERNYFKGLAEKIRGFAILEPKLSLIAREAFACGVLYCKKVRYPGCDVQEAKKWLAKESAWQQIIIFAMLRHGLLIERKMLLEALGCTNLDAYSKSGSELVAFHEDHSNYTPAITFSSYNKFFTSAKKWLTRSEKVNSPSIHSIIEDCIATEEERIGKSAAQKTRNEKIKSLAEHGKEAKAKEAKATGIGKVAQEAIIEQKAATDSKIKTKRIQSANIYR